MSGLLGAIGVFVVLLAVLVALRVWTGNRIEVKTPDMVLALVPIVLIAERVAPAAHTLLFLLSVCAIVPLAALLSHATESVAEKTGEGRPDTEPFSLCPPFRFFGAAARRIGYAKGEQSECNTRQSHCVKGCPPTKSVFERAAQQKSRGRSDGDRYVKNSEGAASLAAGKIVGQQGGGNRRVGRFADADARSGGH